MEKVDWTKFKSDEEIVAKLKELMLEIHISSTEMQAKSTEEVERAIKEYIAGSGFPSDFTVSVSKPNEIGHRMFMGTTQSPLSGKEINF